MKQPILVINCGSSSIKFALFPEDHCPKTTFTGVAERLGEDEPHLILHGDPEIRIDLAPGSGHKEGMRAFIHATQEKLHDLAGVGHRVVHGGERFHDSILLDADNIAELEILSPLAPLHNPMNLTGIHLCKELFPAAPQVAVFDTAFHQSIPEQTWLYGTPYDWYEKAGVRRYGFHGTSYRYILEQASQRLSKPAASLNLLISHLGNGCSVCAVRAGQSVDTSMGLTPLEGVVMGTRCGNIDPGLAQHMLHHSDLSMDDIMTALNKHSGLKGLSGIGNDMRVLLESEAEGHAGAKRAINVFTFRIARELAALSCSLPHLDAVIFTGGIGEHASDIRQRILAQWQSMPFLLDDQLNQQHGDQQGRISQPDTPLVMVIPTSEETMIANDTRTLISQ